MRPPLIAAILAAALLIGAPLFAQAPQASSSLVGAEACKSCHVEIYAAWAVTKHATALNRLSGSEKEGDQCARCHVTGALPQATAESPAAHLPGVQCEACHGAGKAHVESANAGGPTPNLLTRAPKEADCVSCHNDKSPRFKGFLFDAMKGFVHRVP